MINFLCMLYVELDVVMLFVCFLHDAWPDWMCVLFFFPAGLQTQRPGNYNHIDY